MNPPSTAANATGHANSTQAAAWLGRLRAVIFALWAVKVGGASLGTIAWLPHELVEPPLLLQAQPQWAWEWLLRPNVLDGIQVLICLCATMAAAGVRPYRLIAVIAVSLITFEQGLVRSYGITTHPEMFLLLATWIITFAPAADGFCWPARRATAQPANVYVAVIAFVALVGCWTYTATAAFRVAHHGVEMLTGDSMKYFILYNSFAHSSGTAGVFVLEHPALASWIQLGFPVASLLEVAAPLTLLFCRFRRLWLIFLVVFQLLLAVSMTVLFLESTLALAAALIAFDRVSELRSAKENSGREKAQNAQRFAANRRAFYKPPQCH